MGPPGENERSFSYAPVGSARQAPAHPTLGVAREPRRSCGSAATAVDAECLRGFLFRAEVRTRLRVPAGALAAPDPPAARSAAVDVVDDPAGRRRHRPDPGSDDRAHG